MMLRPPGPDAEATVPAPGTEAPAGESDGVVEGTVVPHRAWLRQDAVEVAVGVVSLAAAATRVAARVPRAVAHGLPVPGRLRTLVDRSRLATVGRGQAGLLAAERQLGELADALVPLVAAAVLERVDVVALLQRYVDLDRLAEQLDVDAVVARADLDRVLARIDVDEVADRIDVARIVDRVDLDEIVARVDVDRVVDRLDLDGIVARVDVDRVVARVDVDGVVARVDVDGVVARVDVDGVVSRVDLDEVADRLDVDRVAGRLALDPILERLDLIGLARYIADGMDLPGLVRASTGSMSADLVEGVRAQSATADQTLERAVDRFLRRRGRRTAVTRSAPATTDNGLPGSTP